MSAVSIVLHLAELFSHSSAYHRLSLTLITIGFGALTAILLSPVSLLAWGVREIVFPAGCALIIFASETRTRLVPEVGDAAPSAPA